MTFHDSSGDDTVSDSTSGNDNREQAILTSPTLFSRWSAEAVDFELLGMDPEDPVPTELMGFCCAMLGSAALDADKVTFVITGDFVEAVKMRLPDGPDKETFGTQRGAGVVAAKTMKVGDEVHVIFPQWMFFDTAAAQRLLPAEDASEIGRTEAVRGQQVRRTAVHEAQHVAIAQRGEDRVTLDGLGWATKNLVNVAAQVIEEYRAELAVPQVLRDENEIAVPVDALKHLREGLTRITTVDYQDHRDTGKLSYDVVRQTHHMWKVLAYLAAARRAFGIELGAAFADDLRNSEQWTLLVARPWDRFEALLAGVPSGQASIDPEELNRLASELAELLFEWLLVLGFRWEDVGDHADQSSRFVIESWDLFT